MILRISKTRKQVVLSGNMSELADIFLLTSQMVEAEFASQWFFDRRVLSPKVLPRCIFTHTSVWSNLRP